jgi:hypothetical protein
MRLLKTVRAYSICPIPTARVELELWTVRRAYKQKVLETHPDKLPPDSTEEETDAAREQFSKVSC